MFYKKWVVLRTIESTTTQDKRLNFFNALLHGFTSSYMYIEKIKCMYIERENFIKPNCRLPLIFVVPPEVFLFPVEKFPLKLQEVYSRSELYIKNYFHAFYDVYKFNTIVLPRFLAVTTQQFYNREFNDVVLSFMQVLGQPDWYAGLKKRVLDARSHSAFHFIENCSERCFLDFTFAIPKRRKNRWKWWHKIKETPHASMMGFADLDKLVEEARKDLEYRKRFNPNHEFFMQSKEVEVSYRHKVRQEERTQAEKIAKAEEKKARQAEKIRARDAKKRNARGSQTLQVNSHDLETVYQSEHIAGERIPEVILYAQETQSTKVAVLPVVESSTVLLRSGLEEWLYSHSSSRREIDTILDILRGQLNPMKMKWRFFKQTVKAFPFFGGYEESAGSHHKVRAEGLPLWISGFKPHGGHEAYVGPKSIKGMAIFWIQILREKGFEYQRLDDEGVKDSYLIHAFADLPWWKFDK